MLTRARSSKRVSGVRTASLLRASFLSGTTASVPSLSARNFLWICPGQSSAPGQRTRAKDFPLTGPWIGVAFAAQSVTQSAALTRRSAVRTSPVPPQPHLNWSPELGRIARRTTCTRAVSHDAPYDAFEQPPPPPGSGRFGGEEAPYLEGLNEEQRAVVLAPIGAPMRVLAGPGSGKTRVLTCRVAHLIAEGVDPFEILCITFTNKAAKELRERLRALLGPTIDRSLTVGTFHSVAGQMLRSMLKDPADSPVQESAGPPASGFFSISPSELFAEGPYFGISHNYTIYDQDEAFTALKLGILDLQLRFSLDDMKRYRGWISRVKGGEALEDILDQAMVEGEARKEAELLYERVHGAYARVLQENNATDFDDLLLLPIDAMKDQQHELSRWQARWQHLFVDEFQDSSRIQFEMVSLLTARHRSCFLVGDANQSIYSWRGAHVENILGNFDRTYGDAALSRSLMRNYRCHRTIQLAAASLVSDGRVPVARRIADSGAPPNEQQPLVPGAGWGGLCIGKFDTNISEARAVVQQIKHQVEEEMLLDYKDVGVLFRTRRQAIAIEQQLLQAQIPYIKHGGLALFDRKEIKDLIAYLRLVNNPLDQVSLDRIINVPTRSIGPKTLEQLNRWALTVVKPPPPTRPAPQDPEALWQDPEAPWQDPEAPAQDPERATLASGSEELEVGVAIMMGEWEVGATAEYHSGAAGGAGGDEPWTVYLAVSGDGRKTSVGSTANLPQRLRKLNGAAGQGGNKTLLEGRPWRIAAVVRGAGRKAEAQHVEAAWKSACRQAAGLKLKDPAKFDRLLPPPSACSLLRDPHFKALQRRARAFALCAASMKAAQHEHVAIWPRLNLEWTPDDVLEPRGGTAHSRPPPLGGVPSTAPPSSATSGSHLQMAAGGSDPMAGSHLAPPATAKTLAQAMAAVPAGQLPDAAGMGLTKAVHTKVVKLHSLLWNLREAAARGASAQALLEDLVAEVQYEEFVRRPGKDDADPKQSLDREQTWKMVEAVIAGAESSADRQRKKKAAGEDADPADLHAEPGWAEPQPDLLGSGSPAQGGSNLQQYLQGIALAQAAQAGEDIDAVHLMTVHAAKGLEFDAVFIAGCVDGMIPSLWADSDEQEEKRVFYVGVTRAAKRCFLSWYYEDPRSWGSGSRPSRYLSLIQNVLRPARRDDPIWEAEQKEMERLQRLGWQHMVESEDGAYRRRGSSRGRGGWGQGDRMIRPTGR